MFVVVVSGTRPRVFTSGMSQFFLQRKNKRYFFIYSAIMQVDCLVILPCRGTQEVFIECSIASFVC